MHPYIEQLTTEFAKHRNDQIAVKQAAYMRNQFEFYGIMSLKRNAILHSFFKKENLPEKAEMTAIVKTLWNLPQRECQYSAQELAFKYAKRMEENDISLYEFMVTHKSWWDTVDFVAPKLMGTYFKTFPARRDTFIDNWLQSNNIWLQRAALLFQLKYKETMDTELLHYVITSLSESEEFFIQKAIGWILREYGKTNPRWVKDFVQQHTLQPLSHREALRLLNRKK